MFLPNKHSFLLIRSEIKNPVIQFDVQEVETSLSRSNVGIPTSALEPSSLDLGKPIIGDKIIGDKNKRTFLKMAGIAGASIVGSFFLPKQADALIMGSSPTTGVVGVKNSTNMRINPATEETVATLLKPADLTFDGSGYLNVNVQATPASSSGSFSTSADETTKSALVDAARHVQVDVLSSTLPSSASTETTLQTIAFGGKKYALRLVTDGAIDYVGEADMGTLPTVAEWRIKKIDSTTGIIITWAGTNAANAGTFDYIWNNYATLDYF